MFDFTPKAINIQPFPPTSDEANEAAIRLNAWGEGWEYRSPGPGDEYLGWFYGPALIRVTEPMAAMKLTRRKK